MDQYEKTGKIHVLAEDKQELMDIYNRGGFTDGYFENHNGKDMMSMEVPNHIGVYVGSIEKMNKNQIGFRPRVKIEDFIVEKANHLPTTKEEVIDLINKTGNLNFEFSEIEVELSENVFIPKKYMNHMQGVCGKDIL